jgi:AraC-like DNA-binding protein
VGRSLGIGLPGRHIHFGQGLVKCGHKRRAGSAVGGREAAALDRAGRPRYAGFMKRAEHREIDYNAAILTTNFLRVFCDVLKQNGIDPEPFLALANSQLTLADLSDPDMRVSYRQVLGVVRLATRRYPDLGLGLKLGSRVTLVSYGMLGMAMMTAPRLDDALRLGIDFQRLSGPLYETEFELTDRTLTLVSREAFPDPETALFSAESALAGIVQFFRFFCGEDFAPLRAEFMHARPVYVEQYESWFKCPLVFNAPRTALVVDSAWLDTPIPTHDPYAERQMLAGLRQAESGEAGPSDIAKAIGRMLREDPKHALDMKDVALGLNMSVRTLRRRLHETGQSFRALCHQARKDLAMQLLTQADVSIEKIAESTGFASTHSFYRAFRKWTGRAPGSYRKQ